MSQDLLTIGEFASLAETTKRTVLWYEEKELIKPHTVNNETGYRFYTTSQIIDFKAILLLRKLNFSLAEIKNKKGSLENLFHLKKRALEEELINLQMALKDTDIYYENIKKTGTLVNPKVKAVKAFKVYYLQKTGPYQEISNYYAELRSYFSFIPKETPGVVLYESKGYQPKKSIFKVCFIDRPGLKPIKEIGRMTVPCFKALSYTHVGSTKLLSMLWQEMKKYRTKNGFKENKSLPFEDLELSHDLHITELLMPIV